VGGLPDQPAQKCAAGGRAARCRCAGQIAAVPAGTPLSPPLLHPSNPIEIGCCCFAAPTCHRSSLRLELVLTRPTTFQANPSPPAHFDLLLIRAPLFGIWKRTAMWSAARGLPGHQSGAASPATPPSPSPGARRLMCPTLMDDQKQRRSPEAGEQC
jgi:hypothetical protein